jgi:hypothetical protein
LPHSLIRRVLLGTIVVVFAGTPAAWAQGVGADAVVLFGNHELLGEPLTGFGVRLSSRPSTRVVGVFGAQRLQGAATRTGIPCAGLVNPFDPDCARQPVRDAAFFADAAGGASAIAFAGERATMAVTALAHVGGVRVDSRGLTSGRALSTSSWLWGASLGVEGGWALSRSLPLSLEASANVGGLLPFHDIEGADIYNPLNGGFTFSRLRIGLAWCGIAGGQVRDPNRRGCG